MGSNVCRVVKRQEEVTASNYPTRKFTTAEIKIKNFKLRTPYRGITSHELNGKKQIPSQIAMTSLIALRDQGPYNKEKVYKFLHDGNFSQTAIREIGLTRRLFEHFPFTILAIYPSLEPYNKRKEDPLGHTYYKKVDPGIDQLAISDLEKEVFLEKIVQIGLKERYDAVILPMVSKSADVNIQFWSKLINKTGQLMQSASDIVLIPAIDMNLDTAEFRKLLNFSISASKSYKVVEPLLSFIYHKYETGNVATNTATAKITLSGMDIGTLVLGIKRNLDNGNSGIQDQATIFGDILFLTKPIPPIKKKVDDLPDFGFYNSRLAKIEKLNASMSSADLLSLRQEIRIMFGMDGDFVNKKMDEYIIDFQRGIVDKKIALVVSGIARVHESSRSSSETALLRIAASKGEIDTYAAAKPWLFT